MSETRKVKFDYSNIAYLILLAGVVFDHLTMREYFTYVGMLFGLDLLVASIGAAILAFHKTKAKP